MAQKKTCMIRIGSGSRDVLYDLSAREGRSMASILEDAVKQYWKHSMLREANEAYARLKEQPEKWKEYKEELEAWDVTLGDGLDGF